MNIKRKVYILGTMGNIFLLVKYYWDMNTIYCEPCLPHTPCPLCRTEFMENFWIYFIIWNLIGFLIFALRKRLKTDNSNY